ncbi:MAG: hypothetical protein CL688_06750 [Candidatus Puniceispirillum sp.]|nr:hypothetical protein [Candidatus Puniceispirillum sp.]|tara:strand:+ start:2590 stop:3456 length:867 start_codon:yes stop_codon:yes gene_type:complete
MTQKAAPWQKLGLNLKLGLRACDEANWLPFDDLFGDTTARPRQFLTKTELLHDRHEDVFSALPNSTAASAEVLEIITTHLAAHYPDIPLDVNPSLHPLEGAARLILEDLLILAPRQRSDGKDATQTDWCLVAGALCFPAHWVLQKKMGKPLAAIHEPVPHYTEVLRDHVDRFFTAMKIGTISMRMNWSLQTDDALYAPLRLHQPDTSLGMTCDQIHLRVERQTLRKLPQTGNILFTIRTYLAPVSAWQDSEGAIEDLLFVLGDMSPEMRHYKGATIYETSLRNMLRNE